MMEDKSEQKIQNLLLELVLNICKHITVRDISNAANIIQTWLKVHPYRRIVQCISTTFVRKLLGSTEIYSIKTYNQPNQTCE